MFASNAQRANPPHKIFALVMAKVRDLSILQQHISQQTPLGKSWRHRATREKAIALMRKHPMQIGTVLQRMVATNRQFNSSKADAEEHLHALIVFLFVHIDCQKKVVSSESRQYNN